MEAISWLEPPEPGDAIFLFALDMKGRHHTRFSQVRKSAVGDRIRVFAFLLDMKPFDPPDPLQSFTTRQIESGAFPVGMEMNWFNTRLLVDRPAACWRSRTPGMAAGTTS
jgi:hypothetical protein